MKEIKDRAVVERPGNEPGRLEIRVLDKLPEMPLDILLEIFSHLRPLDLLHLARTTKALRTMLMSRSSISLWKGARELVGRLPDCPSDLSEPQYANLLFDQHCHVRFNLSWLSNYVLRGDL
ncbi:uncharacterized protein LAESUDRAFT_646055 [Laetiporus sulphureus 93-53]|uniref:F-box domain-containing protein n=1 Tax=Laetiporus sulphureus 93-53 TaxID=1314785 RepID=A0A165FZF5_9APHY|nr:uncharacterized protein LAESUDRAFT_646055 [Laetiporus sulphureus 93-53]KZT09619.1 hypothetical protein LAESUDRAFT_646055 [Laetiporus sulphureus 93-53]